MLITCREGGPASFQEIHVGERVLLLRLWPHKQLLFQPTPCPWFLALIPPGLYFFLQPIQDRGYLASSYGKDIAP